VSIERFNRRVNHPRQYSRTLLPDPFKKESDLSAKPASKRHERTRRDHSTETAEDYVEAVADIIDERGACRVVDLAKRFAVSHVTVTKTVSRLKAGNYLTSEPYGPINLTRKGKRVANESRKRHKIVLDFLLALGISESVAEIDAEGMEHHVSQETLQRFAAFTQNAASEEQ
jgi:DtxR family manganese transport transcriptional regulator